MKSCGLFYFYFSEQDMCNEIRVAKFGSLSDGEVVSIQVDYKWGIARPNR